MQLSPVTFRRWHPVLQNAPVETRMFEVLRIAYTHPQVVENLTPQYLEENVIPAIRSERLRVIATPYGNLFYVWLRVDGNAAVSLMAGEEPDARDWRNDTGGLWCHLMVPEAGVPVGFACRAMMRDMLETGVGHPKERLVYLRTYADGRQSRIGYAFLPAARITQ